MFEKQYPFIKVDLLRSGAGALVNRVVSEYAAQTYAADVLQGTASRGGLTVAQEARYSRPLRIAGVQIFAGGFKRQSGLLGLDLSEYLRARLQQTQRQAG